MSLFSTRKSISRILNGFEDCHSHILPGVDDGVRTLEESLNILAIYETVGVRMLWLTPHIMEDIPNTTKKLESVFQKLVEAYDADYENRTKESGSVKPKVKLALAAEYMMDGPFHRRLEEKDLLAHGELKDHLLVETSYFTPPYDLMDTLESIKSAGYFPILAHPERYVYMEKSDYIELKSMGIKFQMNLSSLSGMYGETAMLKAEKMLKHKYYNFVGTDLHRVNQLHAILDSKVMPFEKYIVKTI